MQYLTYVLWAINPQSRAMNLGKLVLDHVETNLFFFNDPPTTEIYTSSHTLSLHDALPIWSCGIWSRTPTRSRRRRRRPRPRTSFRSEEHTSELQSRELISYAVFCLKK